MDSYIPRYIEQFVRNDLKKKMVFIGGPRQVGKTTFSLHFLDKPTEKHPAYINWDNVIMRDSLLRGEIPSNQKLLIFDEIHKFINWRGLIKGFYDTHKSDISFLITGSARLDYYRKGGDSLQGRYHYYRLHPFSINELSSQPGKREMLDLLQFGGFPEPLLGGNERTWRRWQRERLSRVVYDDIRDLENVKEISYIELLAEELPNRVGSPLSVKNLKELLQVSHDSVERWLTILERVYICFRISPFGSARIRAVKKEQKLYLIDWSRVQTEGERFENLVACQLLKYCHFIEDTQGFRMELRFLRDTDRREIDFVVLKEKKPLFAVECKTGERKVNPWISYFRERTEIKEFFQVHPGEKDFGNSKTSVRVLPFIAFCKEMNMP
ncbi:MAG: ATP-binding protein [Spirochaetales bacterium]|nr:ATP-binding protein [Spirochaetales bacterium]